MKWGVVGAIAVLALPLSATAQTVSDKQADMEEALRQQQLICSGMVEVSARGGGHYSGHQLAQCLVALQQQRDEYQRFIAANGAKLARPASASLH
jgi:Spy/CpxP family protein refolding chaperone